MKSEAQIWAEKRNEELGLPPPGPVYMVADSFGFGPTGEFDEVPPEWTWRDLPVIRWFARRRNGRG